MVRLIFILALLIAIFPPLGASGKQGQDRERSLSDETYEVGDPELDVRWIDEKNGDYIPLEAEFVDEEGNPITMGEFIDRPTLILPIYFYCPSSCSLNLMNLSVAIKRSKLQPGEDFKVIAFSFNEEEDTENARNAKENYLRLLPEDFPEENWKFLTGGKESIEAVTEAIGYAFKSQKDGTFIHPSAMVAVDAEGQIIKYIYGSFVPGDVDMALSEAEKGTPAKSIRRFLSYCFNYDPGKSRSVFQNLKYGAVVVLAIFGGMFFFFLRKGGRKKRSDS